MIYKTSLHYPAHDPDVTELSREGHGWFLENVIVTPPETVHSVPGLLIIWSQGHGLGGEIDAMPPRILRPAEPAPFRFWGVPTWAWNLIAVQSVLILGLLMKVGAFGYL